MEVIVLVWDPIGGHLVIIVAHLRIRKQRLDLLVDSGEGWDRDWGDSEHGSSG